METRENEVHEPKISERYFYATMLYCQQCGEFLAKDERAEDIPKAIRVKECKRKMPNYCPSCGARLKKEKED